MSGKLSMDTPSPDDCVGLAKLANQPFRECDRPALIDLVEFIKKRQAFIKKQIDAGEYPAYPNKKE